MAFPSEPQQRVLDHIGLHQLQEGGAISRPRLRTIFKNVDREQLKDIIATLTPTWIRSSGTDLDPKYSLTATGFLISCHAERLRKVYLHLKAFLESKLDNDPDFQHYSWSELKLASWTSKNQNEVSIVVDLAGLSSGKVSGQNDGGITWTRPPGVDELVQCESLDDILQTPERRNSGTSDMISAISSAEPRESIREHEIDVYQEIIKLGSGGFGEVWRVENRARKPFAQKVLREDGRAALERFRREVMLLNKLRHPNIVPIVASELEREPYWYVMPLYERSLLAALKEIQSDPVQRHRIFSAVLEAVAYAHSQDVLHRDLKPDNVLLSKAEVVVADFGMGLILDENQARLTATNAQNMGTILYAAPELIKSPKQATHLADIYSLGRMLYELYGGSIAGVQEISILPRSIAHVVEVATKQRPDDRFSSVRELQFDYWSAVRSTDDSKSSTTTTSRPTEELSKLAEESRRKIVSSIQSGEAPFPFDRALPFTVLVMIPETVLFGRAAELDVGILKKQSPRPMHASGWNSRITHDGVVAFEQLRNTIPDSWALFRHSGVVETIDLRLLRARGDEKVIPSRDWEEDVIRFAETARAALVASAVPAPFWVAISLHRIRGFKIGVDDSRSGFFTEQGIEDRDDIFLPPIRLSDAETKWGASFRLAFDRLWQSAGFERCRNYDKDGVWHG